LIALGNAAAFWSAAVFRRFWMHSKLSGNKSARTLAHSKTLPRPSRPTVAIRNLLDYEHEHELGQDCLIAFSNSVTQYSNPMHDPLEIRHLRYFLAVAEAGSFSRAADRLGISQPSVSQQMRDLESGLRVSLFQRRGKRILLTSTGLIFQEHARAILRQLENFLQEVSSEPGQLRGALHVGVVPVLNVALMPDLLGMFAAKHPGIGLTVEEISSTEIETALEEGRMDVGLGFLTRHSPNLRYERLCTDEFALIVSGSHPWWKRRIIQFSELHQHRLLQLSDTFVMRRMTDQICLNHHVRPRTVAELNAIETLLRALAHLGAAAIMPKIVLRGREALKLKAIRLQGKKLSLEIGLLRLSDSGANSAVSAFTSLAKAEVPKLIKR
jgi:LysR family cyn operon transcriptional activator